MTHKKTHNNILFILILLLLGCAGNKDKTMNPVNNDTSITLGIVDSYARDSQRLDSLLKISSLELQFKKRVKPEEIPLKLAFRQWLFHPKYILGEECSYERWENGKNYFDIWTISLHKKNNKLNIEARIDSICNILLPIKVSYQKKFRGHKLYENRLVLYKHNFFSKENISKNQQLIGSINETFDCW